MTTPLHSVDYEHGFVRRSTALAAPPIHYSMAASGDVFAFLANVQRSAHPAAGWLAGAIATAGQPAVGGGARVSPAACRAGCNTTPKATDGDAFVIRWPRMTTPLHSTRYEHGGVRRSTALAAHPIHYSMAASGDVFALLANASPQRRAPLARPLEAFVMLRRLLRIVLPTPAPHTIHRISYLNLSY